MPSLGWFGSDLWDDAKDAVSSVVDVVGDVLGAVPGASAIGQAMTDLVNGPLRDFANTAVGKTVLRALSTTFYGSIAWPLGPQLASVAFAVPGLLRGEDFEHAWFDEVKWRAEQTAAIAGAGAMGQFSNQVADTLKKWGESIPVDQQITDTVQALAKRYGIREDAAAFARALWDKAEIPPRDASDPVTGRMGLEYQAAQGARITGKVATTAANTADPRAQLSITARLSNAKVSASAPAISRAQEMISFAEHVAPRSEPPPPTPAPVRATAPGSPATSSTTLAIAAGLGVIGLGAASYYLLARGRRRR